MIVNVSRLILRKNGEVVVESALTGWELGSLTTTRLDNWDYDTIFAPNINDAAPHIRYLRDKFWGTIREISQRQSMELINWG